MKIPLLNSNTDIYTIRKGNHFSKPTNVTLWCNQKEYRWTCVLTQSCWYDPPATGHNKLVGVGGFPHHHQNSIRITWMPSVFGVFDLHAYWYKDGVRMNKLLWSVEADEPFSVRIKGGRIEVLTSTASNSVNTGVKLPTWTYLLKPYFGGTDTAPHDMTLIVKQL